MISKKPVAVVTSPYGIIYWLGGKQKDLNPLQSDFDIIRAAVTGIARSSLEGLASRLGISKKMLAEDIFDMSVKTLERKAPQEKLDKKISSHALEIAKLMQHAYEVFEDEDRVRHWISTKNKALNNKTPLQLFDTLTGLGMVSDILTRIEEGVYS